MLPILPVVGTRRVKKDARGLMPLGRFGTADEAANVALFLAPEESSFITGSEIAVDGGFAQL